MKKTRLKLKSIDLCIFAGLKLI